MNQQTNYPYNPQAYGQLVETDENIPKGQPVENQIQMASMVNNQQSVQRTQANVQQYAQQQSAYNYPPMPQQHIVAPNMYASNPLPQPNTNYPIYPQAQLGVPPQQNFGVVPLNRFPTSRHAQQIFCENCKQNVESKVGLKNGSGAYIAGGVIAACGFWLGCCLIPCMIDDCKDAQHFCTRCGMNLGSKRFLFD